MGTAKVGGDGRGRGRERIYPWEEWFAAGTFELRRGRDYHVSDDSMAAQVRNHACPLGRTAHVERTPRGLRVTLGPPAPSTALSGAARDA